MFHALKKNKINGVKPILPRTLKFYAGPELNLPVCKSVS